MKNQYFGDVRDLFKYDIIQEVMQNCHLEQFSFIPMLTKNDGGGDGNNRISKKITEKGHRPGTGNKELAEFLGGYNVIKPENRDFTKIQNYFTGKGIHADIICPYDYFTNKTRYEYFSKIPQQSLESSLVFVDPDNGLEVNNQSKKHILYSEARGLYERMSGDSVLMIYQHFPREKHDMYINRRLKELREKTGSSTNPLWISDNEIIFFFLIKSDLTFQNLDTLKSEYLERYEKCRKILDHSLLLSE